MLQTFCSRKDGCKCKSCLGVNFKRAVVIQATWCPAKGGRRDCSAVPARVGLFEVEAGRCHRLIDLFSVGISCEALARNRSWLILRSYPWATNLRYDGRFRGRDSKKIRKCWRPGRPQFRNEKIDRLRSRLSR